MKVICNTCKKEFDKRPSRVKEHNYCSEKWSQESRKLGKEVACSECGKKVYKNRKDIKDSESGHLFCSQSCSATYFNKNRIDGNHHNYKGENVLEYKLKALRKYGNKCNRCGFDSNVKILQVHHKDYNKKNNDIGNLEVLCPNCHCEEHYG